MNQSETTGEIAKALAAAQATMQNAPLNKVNPHFKSKYADLAAIRDAAVPALSKHSIAVSQMIGVNDEGRAMLRTVLTHESGEWMDSLYPLPNVIEQPQKMGSALTYAKRYSLASMVCISADEDDDGNNAEGPPPKSSAQAKRDGDFDAIKKELDAAGSLDELAATWKAIQPRFRTLNENWREAITDYKDACKAALDKPAPLDPEAWLSGFGDRVKACKSADDLNDLNEGASQVLAQYPDDIQKRANKLVLDAAQSLTMEDA